MEGRTEGRKGRKTDREKEGDERGERNKGGKVRETLFVCECWDDSEGER